MKINNFSKINCILLILLSFVSLIRIHSIYYDKKNQFIKCNFSNLIDILLSKLIKPEKILAKSEIFNKRPFLYNCLLCNKNKKMIVDNINNIEFIQFMKKANKSKCLSNTFYDELSSLKNTFFKNDVQKKLIFDEIKNILINFKYKVILVNHFKYMNIKISFIIGLVCILFKYIAYHKKYHKNKRIESFQEKDKMFNDSCIICLENFSANKKQLIKHDKIVFLECKHIFHERCIIKWLKDHDKCPICRFNLFLNKRIED